MRRWIICTAATIALLALVAGCGQPDAGQDRAGPSPAELPTATPPSGAVHPDAIWFEVLAVSQDARDHGDIELAQDAQMLADLWHHHSFVGRPPRLDLDEHVALVVTRPEDACPDELVELRLVDGTLRSTYLPPPGGCEQPLIPTAYAIALHRGDLPEQLTVVLEEHEGHGGDVEQTFALSPYDGPPAPAPSPPPRQVGAEELAAVFADHPLRRCEELPDGRSEPTVDGPLAEDEEVAAVQQQRTEYGLPSDEATVRDRLADPDADGSFGFPMTAEEHDEVMDRNRMDLTGDLQESYATEHIDTFGYLLIDQASGGTVVVGVTDDLDGHRERLAERHPGAPIRVEKAPATRRELQAAQEAANALFAAGGPQVVSSSYSAYLSLGVIDPTREDLDAIAAVVDPAITCVDPILSGLPQR